jgi:hypothetical protein
VGCPGCALWAGPVGRRPMHTVLLSTWRLRS